MAPVHRHIGIGENIRLKRFIIPSKDVRKRGSAMLLQLAEKYTDSACE